VTQKRVSRSFSGMFARVLVILALIGTAGLHCLGMAVGCFLLLGNVAFGQLDQATITGIVQDSSGAVIGNAEVTLTNLETGLVLQTRTDKSGVYNFSPIKIGNYSVGASAPGFSKTVREKAHVDMQDRLAVNLMLRPGAISETVNVSTAPPLLQTDEASVGQVFDSRTIEDTPLNGRNYLYAAQLTNGVVSASGFRAAGEGGFSSNGSKAVLNNFVLDGADNNNYTVDFLSGSPLAVLPPPEAISEFKVQTEDYSAEFGHSSGAVINASVKAGTNQLHGDLWEYVRNNAFDARDYFNPASCPPAGCALQGDLAGPPVALQENQFGADLGLPIIKDKLFFFGDMEDSRIVQGSGNSLFTVPTAKEGTGDFSEMLDPNLAYPGAGAGIPIQLYEPGSSGTAVLGSACGNANNVMCASEINPIAQRILNLFPKPNTNLVTDSAGNPAYALFNNYVVSTPQHNNTLHWDSRLDWNKSAKDQAFVRYSNSNNGYRFPPPLGVLDGGNYSTPASARNVSQNIAVSETHIFTPTLINEARYSFNYGTFTKLPNTATNSSSLGLGGLPSGIGLVSISPGGNNGLSGIGSAGWLPADEHQNVWTLADNLTLIKANHSLKMGASIQGIRFSTLATPNTHGYYGYSGQYTEDPANPSVTGSGVADFLADFQNNAGISTGNTTRDYRWDNALFFQDDWKIFKRLTLNLGLRWELQTPIAATGGQQGNMLPNFSSFKCVPDPTYGICDGFGTGTYFLPGQTPVSSLPPAFISYLAGMGITVQNINNPYLVGYSKRDFAPRIGFAYQPTNRLVVRAGFGIYYGALESVGFGGPNMAYNYPFTYFANFYSPVCNPGSCAGTDGVTLKNGFPAADLGSGLEAAAALQEPQLDGTSKQTTPYTMQVNFSLEYALTRNTSASVAYVGSLSRHTNDFPYYNALTMAAMDYQTFGNSVYATAFRPANDTPATGGYPPGNTPYWFQSYEGLGNYNSLQAKIEHKFSSGLHFLGTYTWSHALDDTTGNGIENGKGDLNALLVPTRLADYGSSVYDVRHRFTFTGGYDLPVGKGRKWLNRGGFVNSIVGGWSSSLAFIAQSGDPLNVGTTPSPSGIQGLYSRPYLVGNPYKGGGQPTMATVTATGYSAGNEYPNGQGITSCPATVGTLQNWYNPCAFLNPPSYDSNPLGLSSPPPFLPPLTTAQQVLPYLGSRPQQINGPGWNRLDMSLFKHFSMPWGERQTLTFRMDAFNVLNHPAFADPSTNTTGGQITSTKTFQNFTVDSRALQFSLKYSF
jgi:Carboxypeptidase regulatory-like domain